MFVGGVDYLYIFPFCNCTWTRMSLLEGMLLWQVSGGGYAVEGKKIEATYQWIMSFLSVMGVINKSRINPGTTTLSLINAYLSLV